jgi:hypothetical protein
MAPEFGAVVRALMIIARPEPNIGYLMRRFGCSGVSEQFFISKAESDHGETDSVECR